MSSEDWSHSSGYIVWSFCANWEFLNLWSCIWDLFAFMATVICSSSQLQVYFGCDKTRKNSCSLFPTKHIFFASGILHITYMSYGWEKKISAWKTLSITKRNKQKLLSLIFLGFVPSPQLGMTFYCWKKLFGGKICMHAFKNSLLFVCIRLIFLCHF